MYNIQMTKQIVKIAEQFANETKEYYLGKIIIYSYETCDENDQTIIESLYCVVTDVHFNMNDNRFTFRVTNCDDRKDIFWIGDDEKFEVIE